MMVPLLVKTVLVTTAAMTALAQQNPSASEKPLTFKKTKLTVAHTTITAEIADTDELRERGLMHRTELADGAGMIFIFPNAQILNFWMKNTLIPLSIGYFDEKGKLLQILDMEPASPMDLQPKTYPSDKPSRYALEVAKGWFQRKKIKAGAKLKLPIN